MKQIKNKKYRSLTGFTLIELLVVCTVLVLLLGIILGVFISAIRIQRHSLAVQQLINQASYATEYISRALRLAKEAPAGSTCIPAGTNYLTAGSSVTFLNLDENGDLVCKKFYLDLDSDRLKAEKDGVGGYNLFLTPEKVKVKHFNVLVLEEVEGVDTQPRVTIFFEMENSNVSPTAVIKIQTTVSQRDLNVAQ